MTLYYNVMTPGQSPGHQSYDSQGGQLLFKQQRSHLEQNI